MWYNSLLSFFLIDWCTTQTITVLVKVEFLLRALQCRIRHVFIDLELPVLTTLSVLVPLMLITKPSTNTHLLLELLPKTDLVSISWYHLIYFNAAESPGLLINLDTCCSCLAYALKGHWENLSCFIWIKWRSVCLWHFLSQCYDNDSWKQQFAGNHDALALKSNVKNMKPW